MTIDWIHETVCLLTKELREKKQDALLREVQRHLEDTKRLLLQYEAAAEKRYEQERLRAEADGREIGEIPF